MFQDFMSEHVSFGLVGLTIDAVLRLKTVD